MFSLSVQTKKMVFGSAILDTISFLNIILSGYIPNKLILHFHLYFLELIIIVGFSKMEKNKNYDQKLAKEKSNNLFKFKNLHCKIG